MTKAKTPVVDPTPAPTTPVGLSPDISALVNALVQAIQLTKPVEKKNAANRKPGSPWDPKDGSKKLKLKRKMTQHSILIDPDFLSNEEIDLLNKLKVGSFMDGWVKVYRRKDHGIDIDYPVKTASQRLKLVSQYGIRNLKELLERCIAEAANPVKDTDTQFED